MDGLQGTLCLLLMHYCMLPKSLTPKPPLAPTSDRKEVDIGTMWIDSRSSAVVIGCLYRFFYMGAISIVALCRLLDPQQVLSQDCTSSPIIMICSLLPI